MTSSIPLDEAAESFSGLARLVYDGESYPVIFEHLCRTAVEVVPGCDHACVTTLAAGQPPKLEATTDDVAARADRLEWETGEGPCVDAILTQRFEWDADLSHRPTWPRFAKRLLEETPVRGMIGYRITVGDRKLGALNLMSDTPAALTQDSADVGAILAAFASVAMTAAVQRDEAASLREGIVSNREIGNAVGLLMATHHVSDTDAFDRLRRASSRLNVRLAEIARRLVREHNARVGDAPE
jgi:transcriptional regulator with GAF, ATPase, and Fis domain